MRASVATDCFHTSILVGRDLQRLSALREERLRLAQKTEARRISALQKQAVKAGVWCVCASVHVCVCYSVQNVLMFTATSVQSALNADDQDVLKDSGIILPEVAHKRQRKRRHHDSTADDNAASHHAGHTADVASIPNATHRYW